MNISSFQKIENKFVLYFDGCSKSNPGLAGAGAVLYKNGKELGCVSHFLGLQTNNYAEYTALIKGFDIAKRNGAVDLLVKGDSLLVINQMSGTWKVSNENIRPLYLEAKELERKISGKVTYEHIKRDLNKRADTLANEALLKSYDANLDMMDTTDA